MKTGMKRPSGTQEWACRTRNVCEGCLNDCKYCYAKSMAIRFGRSTPETWRIQTPLPGRLKSMGLGAPTRIMFPSTHDITPASLDLCIEALSRMLAKGHSVLIVTKPRLECVKGMCTRLGNHRRSMMFRLTIGSASDNVLSFWEPNAPSFEERIESLKFACSEGYETSVSCEPMLDDRIDEVVDVVTPFVTHSIWLGLPNMLRQRLAINGADQETLQRAEELLRLLNKEYVAGLHGRHSRNAMVRWKDSIKSMLGLPPAPSIGLDI